MAWNGVRRGATTGVEDVSHDVSYGMEDAGHDVTCDGVTTER